MECGRKLVLFSVHKKVCLKEYLFALAIITTIIIGNVYSASSFESKFNHRVSSCT